MSTQHHVLIEATPGVAPDAAACLAISPAQNSLSLPEHNLSIRCGLNCARLIGGADEVCGYQRLRYESFVLHKGWVKADPAQPGLETDHYDPYCYHLGVFQGPHLVAYLRALPWEADPGFMLEHEFRDLLTAEAALDLAHAGNVELSRLVVAPPAGSGPRESLVVAELLFKLLYQLGKRQDWEAYYIVLEEAWLRILNRRFELPFAPLGVPHIYPNGTKTLAAHARCDALEESIKQTSPVKYRWYQQSSTP